MKMLPYLICSLGDENTHLQKRIVDVQFRQRSNGRYVLPNRRSGMMGQLTALAELQTFAKAVDAWGRLDVLVNDAGAGATLPLAGATPDQITNILAVNVLSPGLLAAAALPYPMVTKGTIINVSSTFGHKPVSGLSHYAASKAALEHLTRCRALAFAHHNVRVNAVAAEPTDSGALTGIMGLSPEQAVAIKEPERERIPLKRCGNPDDVARWIVFLADPSSEWMTGQVIAVDGGTHCASHGSLINS